MSADRPTMTVNQAAEHVQVSRRTIYNWVKAKKVQTIRTVGGSIRIYVDTLYQKPEDAA